MTSTTVAQFLEDIGVTRTHSHPHVSDDNHCIEAHLTTLKYCPGVARPLRHPRHGLRLVH